MREVPEILPATDEVRPAALTAALRVGWTYQILVLGGLFFYYLPQQQAYITSLADKPAQQMTRDDINMFLHPDAVLIGLATPFVLMFALSAWLLLKTGQGRIWARNVLAALFGFRILVGVAVSQNAFTLFDVIAQVAVIMLLYVPASRAWFDAKNVGFSGGGEGRYRVDG